MNVRGPPAQVTSWRALEIVAAKSCITRGTLTLWVSAQLAVHAVIVGVKFPAAPPLSVEAVVMVTVVAPEPLTVGEPMEDPPGRPVALKLIEPGDPFVGVAVTVKLVPARTLAGLGVTLSVKSAGWLKLAVSLVGLVMLNVSVFVLLLVVMVPVKPVNWKPLLAVALTVTPNPLFHQLMPGLGLIIPPPPVPTAVVREYCVVKVAVWVVAAVTVIECEAAPLSDQLAHAYCEPVPPACGVAAAIV